jgi:adenylate kinase
MRQAVVAVVGVSGVGKSALLREIATNVEFQHLSAGALIGEGRNAVGASRVGQDDLRAANIDDNQILLVHGFQEARDPNAHLVVIDGHTIIDTPSGLVRIAPHVFECLNVSQFVFLADEPEAIRQRRLSDGTRQRPARTAEELGEHQAQALLCAFDAALRLDVPLSVFSTKQLAALTALLINVVSS